MVLYIVVILLVLLRSKAMKNRRNLSGIAWKGAILLCVVLSLFAFLFTSCTNYKGSDEFVSEKVDKQDKNDKENNKDKEEEPAQPGEELTDPLVPVGDPETEDPAQPEDQPQQSGFVLGETEDAGREYLDKIIFLGDSTTYGIGYYYNQGYDALCPPSQIWTPSSGTLTLSNQSTATVVYPATGEEIPIIDAVTDAKPQIMLLTLGVNGVSFMDKQWFVDEYSALVNNIKAASPDTKIILNSIYPVAASYKHIDSISNEKILAANDWIREICEATGCKYLNTYEILVQNGVLPEAAHNGDGIHLSGETFTKVMDYIRTHAYN